jgi:hypothetical protein
MRVFQITDREEKLRVKFVYIQCTFDFIHNKVHGDITNFVWVKMGSVKW